MVKKNINVDYCTNTSNEKIVNNVKYLKKKKIDKNIIYDLAITISDSNQFDLVESKKKAIFSVSNQPFEKFLRKKQFFSFLKHKPSVVTLCNYQYEKRSFITCFFGKNPRTWHLEPPRTPGTCFLEKIQLHFSLFLL